MAEAARVVIVGAGPAGMALGYLLARRGIQATVLETHRDFARAFRGEGLQMSDHLVPVLLAGGDGAAIDAAARRVRDERWPEIVAAQKMQQHQARMMFAPDNWRGRMMYRMVPFMMRTGLMPLLNRKEYRLMSQGVVPVKLAV